MKGHRIVLVRTWWHEDRSGTVVGIHGTCQTCGGEVVQVNRANTPSALATFRHLPKSSR